MSVQSGCHVGALVSAIPLLVNIRTVCSGHSPYGWVWCMCSFAQVVPCSGLPHPWWLVAVGMGPQSSRTVCLLFAKCCFVNCGLHGFFGSWSVIVCTYCLPV